MVLPIHQAAPSAAFFSLYILLAQIAALHGADEMSSSTATFLSTPPPPSPTRTPCPSLFPPPPSLTPAAESVLGALQRRMYR